jgi:hypothetical protein
MVYFRWRITAHEYLFEIHAIFEAIKIIATIAEISTSRVEVPLQKRGKKTFQADED